MLQNFFKVSKQFILASFKYKNMLKVSQLISFLFKCS